MSATVELGSDHWDETRIGTACASLRIGYFLRDARGYERKTRGIHSVIVRGPIPPWAEQRHGLAVEVERRNRSVGAHVSG